MRRKNNFYLCMLIYICISIRPLKICMSIYYTTSGRPWLNCWWFSQTVEYTSRQDAALTVQMKPLADVRWWKEVFRKAKSPLRNSQETPIWATLFGRWVLIWILQSFWLGLSPFLRGVMISEAQNNPGLAKRMRQTLGIASSAAYWMLIPTSTSKYANGIPRKYCPWGALLLGSYISKICKSNSYLGAHRNFSELDGLPSFAKPGGDSMPSETTGYFSTDFSWKRLTPLLCSFLEVKSAS